MQASRKASAVHLPGGRVDALVRRTLRNASESAHLRAVPRLLRSGSFSSSGDYCRLSEPPLTHACTSMALPHIPLTRRVGTLAAVQQLLTTVPPTLPLTCGRLLTPVRLT